MAQSKFTKHFRALTKYRKLILVVALLFVAVLSFSALFSQQAFAEEDSSEYVVETTFFGNLKDDGKGCGVYTVLNLVVDILSLGVGILGVIGIMVVGIQYLTAKGNEQQATKAKRRLFEIVIGLIAYAVLFVFTQWLLPGGRLSTNTTCATMSDSELAALKAKEEAARQEAADKANQQGQKTGKTNKSSGSSTDPPNASTAGEQIAQTAELLAWPKGTPAANYTLSGSGISGNVKSWDDLGKAKPTEAFMTAYDKVRPRSKKKFVKGNLGADCGVFVTTVLRYSGHDPSMSYGKAEDYYGSKKKKWQQVTSGGAKRGDVCVGHPNGGFHTKIYLGSKNGHTYIAEAQNNSRNGGRSQFGAVKKGNCSGYNVWRPL